MMSPLSEDVLKRNISKRRVGEKPVAYEHCSWSVMSFVPGASAKLGNQLWLSVSASLASNASRYDAAGRAEDHLQGL